MDPNPGNTLEAQRSRNRAERTHQTPSERAASICRLFLERERACLCIPGAHRCRAVRALAAALALLSAKIDLEHIFLLAAGRMLPNSGQNREELIIRYT